jgi:hypothetical protein
MLAHVEGRRRSKGKSDPIDAGSDRPRDGGRRDVAIGQAHGPAVRSQGARRLP